MHRQANISITLWAIFALAGLVGQVAADEPAPTVGKWQRYILNFENKTWQGNPFEIEFNGVFTHLTSGKRLILPGYYAGGNTWKIGFMPTDIGKWRWRTESVDSELNNRNGSVVCRASGLPGMLKADSRYSRKWRFTDGPYVVPVALRMEIFFEDASTDDFANACDFLKNEVNGQLFETRLLDESRWYAGRSDYIFEGNWQAHRFDLAVWDRMETRMELLTARGLGAHVMFYSDDAGTPGWKGQSTTEALVIRYAVARLAAFPVVWFNTGIDIIEYRSQEDINWFGEEIRRLDPYGHPISSRRGGGSGELTMQNRTFESWGDRHSRIEAMRNHYLESELPVSMDDAWGENRGIMLFKDHSEHDIRRAFWKAVIAGGVGGLVRGGGDGLPTNGFFSIRRVKQDLESEQWIAHVNAFVKDQLGPLFGAMEPNAAIARDGHALSDPEGRKILVFRTGRHDRYDPALTETFDLQLPARGYRYAAIWYDPRTGAEHNAGIIIDGGRRRFAPPSGDDWLLLLSRVKTE
jgi:hypothetical protein